MSAGQTLHLHFHLHREEPTQDVYFGRGREKTWHAHPVVLLVVNSVFFLTLLNSGRGLRLCGRIVIGFVEYRSPHCSPHCSPQCTSWLLGGMISSDLRLKCEILHGTNPHGQVAVTIITS